ALGVLVGDRAREVGLAEAVHEGALLGLERIPLRAQVDQRREVRVAGQPGRRPALPALEPHRIRPVDVREHPLHGRDTPVLAHVARDGVAEVRRDLEQPPVRPSVIVVESTDQLQCHLEPPLELPSPRTRSSPTASYCRTATVSPSCTVCPSATVISLTVPALGASTGISIFMDSSTMTGSPAATASPALAVIWKTTPVMWALTSSAIERSLFDHLGVHRAGAKGGAPHDAPEERDHRLDALDHEPVEGDRHPGDGLLAGG